MIETIFGIFRKSQKIPSFETNIFHRPLQKMVCSGATAKFLWRVMMVQQYLLAAVGEISILVEPVLFTSEDLLFLFREGDAISLDIQSYLVTECLKPQTSFHTYPHPSPGMTGGFWIMKKSSLPCFHFFYMFFPDLFWDA